MNSGKAHKLKAVVVNTAMAFFMLSLHAQVPLTKDIEQNQNDPYYFRKCKSQFMRIPLQVEGNNYIGAVMAYLKANIPNLQPQEAGLILLHDIQSAGGRHLTFGQTFSGMPVFHSQIKVNIDKKNTITSIFDNSWSTAGWDEPALKDDFGKLNLAGIKSQLTGQRSLDDTYLRIKRGIAVLNERPFALAEVELQDMTTGEHTLMLADNKLNIFLRRSLNTYLRDTATAMVFLPDPLTSAHVYYGSPYVDDSNRDVSVLNAQRKPVNLEVTYDSGMYKLQNQYVIISEFSYPEVAPAVSPTPEFIFTRAQSGFEDVNAFYHITAFSRYIESLNDTIINYDSLPTPDTTIIGFGNLVSIPVLVDAHGQNGADNSMFTPGFNGPQLSFGDGGVDDAEDADVIIHEFGHVLSYSASPGTNSGHERSSVDEGLGDYFATSYSKSIDTFRWADMFTWDGYNEYWNGRKAVTSKVYPADLSGSSIHANGEIYNSALMRIWEQLGRRKTDRLVLQSMYYLAPDMSMKDAAMTLYDADRDLYESASFCAIYYALLERGLTDTFPDALCHKVDTTIALKAGNDQIICKGDSAILGDAAAIGSGFTYRWSPAEGLGSPNSPLTRAAPRNSTTYVLTASRFDRSYNTDTVQVTSLESCFLNTEGFVRGEDVIIKLPANTHNNRIELFDISGKRLFCATDIPGEDYHLNGSTLPAGVYIVRVSSIRGRESQKLVKVSE